MKPVEIITSLLAAKSDKKKLKIIENAWNSDSDSFFFGIAMSTNPSTKYNISKVPEILDEEDGNPGKFTFKNFLDLCDFLQNKTEKECKEELDRVVQLVNITEWNLFYRKIILKNLQNDLPMNLIVSTLKTLTNLDKSVKSN